MPARSGGAWTTASAEVAEASAVLKALLRKVGVTDAAVDRQGAHACKATLLSWGAKAGIKSEFRRLLGGHARPKERMVLEYSRDALAGPLVAMAAVLFDIKCGAFDPDADRSGRRGAFGDLAERMGLERSWPASGDAAPEAAEDFELDACKSTPSDSEESSSTSEPEPDKPPSKAASSTDVAAETSIEVEPCTVDGVVPQAEAEPKTKGLGDGRALWVHTRYRTLHAARPDDDSDTHLRLACGIQKARAERATCVFVADFRGVCSRCFSDA